MRDPQDVYKATRVLRGLQAAGLDFFPLGVRTKLPRDKGFLLNDYPDPDFAGWFSKWGNWGIRAKPGQLIIDVDPRHGGNESLEMLKWEVDDDLSRYPYTVTGSGGKHIFMTRPADGRWKWHVKGLPGIDFQGLGRYVVAPGSIHPTTGRPYVLHVPGGKFEMLPAPPKLVALLTKPPRTEERDRPPGVIPNEMLAMLLRRLDIMDYASGGPHYGEWLEISMGCHYGTNGDGWEEWLAWCDGDPNRAAERETNLYRWDSFDSNRDDGVTWRTLLRAVANTGKDGASIVGKLRVRGESARGNNAISAAAAEFGAAGLLDLYVPEDEEEPAEPAPDEWESDV